MFTEKLLCLKFNQNIFVAFKEKDEKRINNKRVKKIIFEVFILLLVFTSFDADNANAEKGKNELKNLISEII